VEPSNQDNSAKNGRLLMQKSGRTGERSDCYRVTFNKY